MLRAPHAIVPDLLRSERGRLAIGVIVFLAYIVTARIGLSIQSVGTFSTLLWPPSGIALATILLCGYRFWPAIALAAFAVNLSTGAPLPAAFAVAAGNTLETFAAAYILKHYVRFNPEFLRLRDSAGLILVAFGTPLIAASVAVISLHLGGVLITSEMWATWFTWWAGDVLGILLFTPFLVKWLTAPSHHRTLTHYIELTVIILTNIAVCLFALVVQPTHFSYFIFVPLGWAALRTGLRGTTLTLLVVASVEIWLTISGHGSFATDDGSGLLLLQIFLTVLSCFFLLFASIVEELRKARLTLQEHVAALELSLNKVSSEDDAKSEFLAILAHEMRNPLAAILSSVELLKLRGIDEAESGQLLDTVDTRVRGMASLLEDLLDISRISQRHFKLDMQTVALNAVIERSEQAYTVIMRTHGLRFRVKRPAEELYVVGDPMRIEQVVNNLLGNSVKYTGRGGTVELFLEEVDDKAEIHVRDTGIGIPRSMLTQIFRPFYQIERGKRPSDGLGIGLSLTRQLVELHGGTIEAQSEGEKKGSEFIVRLPLTEAADEPTDYKTLRGSHGLRRTTHARRMLVVDDNEAFADGMRQLLEMRGHTIAVAHTGKDALLQAAAHHPEVVLLDVGLPDIPGYQVATELRKKYPSLIILALTGYGQREDKEKALQSGFDRHLTKPVGLREVETALRSIKHS